MDTLKQVIDKAAEICGSQNKLAEKLGTSSGALATAKAGGRSIPGPQIRILAGIVGVPAGEVWDLMEQANRNRKKSYQAAVSAALSVVVAGVLSLAPFGESRAATGTYSDGSAADRMHIVISNRLRRLFARRRRTAPA